MMQQRPMGDPNTARRQQMLASLLQGGQPAPQQPNMAAGLASGMQQAFQRPDVQKWIMQLFGRGPAMTGGPMQGPAPTPDMPFASSVTTPGQY